MPPQFAYTSASHQLKNENYILIDGNTFKFRRNHKVVKV